MRLVAIPVLVVAALAAIQAPAPAVGPLALQKGPSGAPPGPPLGIVWGLARPHAVLARLDPSTLAPGQPRLRLGRTVGAWSYDPADRWLVAATDGTILRFVDVDRMRMLGSVRLSRQGRYVSFLAWLFPNRFLAVYPRVGGGAELVWVDAAKRRVLQRKVLDTMPWTMSSGGGTTVALLPPSTPSISGARLAVAHADGRLQVVNVPRIQIGSVVPNQRDRGIFRRVLPGLAVSFAGERAYLVGVAGIVAEVDLHTLAVSYHSTEPKRSFISLLGSWLVPAAQAKGVDGPLFRAQWLGDGVLAVAGARQHLSRTGRFRQTVEPAGLRLIDTRRWTQRTLDERASDFALAGDAILAFGVRSAWGTGEPTYAGMGVSAYRADGTKQYDALTELPISFVQPGNGRAYAWRSDTRPPWRVAVVDLATGTVEQELTLTHPTRLLLGEPLAFSY